MVAGQSPTGGCVVPRCGGEQGGRAVTVRAVCRSECRPRCRVHRVIRVRPVGQVAACICAVGRCNLQTVIAIDVALRAGSWRNRVLAGQRKACGAVIKD